MKGTKGSSVSSKNKSRKRDNTVRGESSEKSRKQDHTAIAESSEKSRKQDHTAIAESSQKSSNAAGEESSEVMELPSALFSQLAQPQNEFLLKMILERLPILKIAAFRYVSKEFQSIIDGRSFAPACLKPRGLVLTFDQRHKIYIPLSSVPGAKPNLLRFEYDVILQESNGLLLCSNITEWDMRTRGRLCVINTGTGTKQFLPTENDGAREGNANARRSSKLQLQGYVRQMSTTLAYDPLICPTSYQLVSIWSHTDNLDSKYRIEVYTSKKGTWKLCYRNGVHLHHLAITPSNSILQKSGVYWKGSINWCKTDGGLVCYNINRRQLSSVQPPQIHNQNIRDSYFDQCRGQLILIRISTTTGSFHVFDMGLSHSGWQFKYTMHLQHIAPELGFPGSSFDVLLADIEDLGSVYVVAKGTKVFKIHSEKMLLEDLGVQLQHNGNFDTFKYVDTASDCCFHD